MYTSQCVIEVVDIGSEVDVCFISLYSEFLFSFEFTGYFLDRNSRIPTMKKNLEDLLEANKRLSEEQEELKKKYG